MKNLDPPPQNKPLEQQQTANNNKPLDPPSKSLDQHKSLPHTPKSPYVADAVKAPSAVELLQRLRGLDPFLWHPCLITMDPPPFFSLDAFMAEINKQAQTEIHESRQKEEHVINTGDFTGGQEGRDDIEQEDMQESMIKFMEEYKERHASDDEDENVVEYDEEGNVIWTWKKEIDPLPPIDHSEIEYKPFGKNFYSEHPDIADLTLQQAFELWITLDIRVYGQNIPKPVVSFGHFQFDKPIMNLIVKNEFEKPTPIQSQVFLQFQQLYQAETGKTLAYIWPTIVHIMNQEELAPGDGPIALIVVPTRELAIQVYNEAKRYTSLYNIALVCAYGGGSKYEQKKALENGAELVIGTPVWGRIIDLVKIEATNFLRTTFLVLDEVDRMFDLGFEAQVKSISDHIRPDKQCLVFSATCKPKIEKLIMHVLYNPIKILCGDIGENTLVQQQIIVLYSQEMKYEWLFRNIVNFITMGKVLIFVTKKADAEDVSKKLALRDLETVLLHGDMHQQERNERITSFRTNKSVLVATDVAARGLDIPEIRNVINFDVARDIDTHIHRIGRTGRAGHQGSAYTLVLEKDSEFCAHLIENLKSSDQEKLISNELEQIALKCQWYAKRQEKEKNLSGGKVTDAAGNYIGINQFKPKERPGFGLKKTPTTSVGFGLEGGSSGGGGGSSSILQNQPSITKQIARAKTLVGSGGAAGMNKIDIMRSALKGTFKHSFQPSSTDEFHSRLGA
uniref:RNA helicase n=1 Tax=Meloidogyne floridensis TaxID=298350 RepID=A0A915NHS5_9BILA